ncbi:843_t:CDS:2, partial [Entrophospora sp. SA101]
DDSDSGELTLNPEFVELASMMKTSLSQENGINNLNHTRKKKLAPESFTITSTTYWNSTEINEIYYVYKRPYLDLFLEKTSEWFNIVVFTASVPDYANKILDYIDPENKYFCKRFYRESCILYKQNRFIKDLGVVGSDLKKVCMIDDNYTSFAFHKENGIKLVKWTQNNDDDEVLLHLISYLESMKDYEDVRDFIRI